MSKSKNLSSTGQPEYLKKVLFRQDGPARGIEPRMRVTVQRSRSLHNLPLVSVEVGGQAVSRRHDPPAVQQKPKGKDVTVFRESLLRCGHPDRVSFSFQPFSATPGTELRLREPVARSLFAFLRGTSKLSTAESSISNPCENGLCLSVCIKQNFFVFV